MAVGCTRSLRNTRRSTLLRHPLRLLILGGTTEASLLARTLADDPTVAPVLSLAGRTKSPVLPPVPVRIGGFGGVEGLASYLAEAGTQVVVDATHPFAPKISANAAAACARLELPLATFTRAAWDSQDGDRWTAVSDLAATGPALGPKPCRVFVTTGRLELAPFRAAPQHHYLIRTIDPPAADDLPADHRLILARGPFSVEEEIALMRAERVDVLVTKNSGGDASFAKVAAARALGVPVVMVERPAASGGPRFTLLANVLSWIATHRGASTP